jgi:hypothetical protein
VNPPKPYRDPIGVEPEPEPGRRPTLERIGSLRSVHEAPPLGRALALPLVIATLTGGVGVAMGGPGWVVAPFALAVFGVLASTPLRLRGFSAALHAEGLVLSRAGTSRVVAFTDVNEIWFDLDMGLNDAGVSLRGLRLLEHSGEWHALPLGVRGAAALASGVLRACAGPLVIEARRALDEGETLTFGRVLLDRRGVVVDGAGCSWSEIRSVMVQRGKVRLYRRSPILAWRTVRLDRLPHPTVFISLLSACVAGRVRVDDPIVIPFASSEEQSAAQSAAYAAEGGQELALRHMAIGGVSLIIGALLTYLSFASKSGTRLLFYGPLIFGGIWFFRGLVAYLSSRRR